MRKLTTITAILLTISACYSPQRGLQKVTTSKQTEQHINDKYVLTTPFGHKLEVEMDYKVGETGYINNGCKAQFILTNIGNKVLDRQAMFVRGYTVIRGTRFDSLHSVSSIIFEFTTSDNKRIEASSSLSNDKLLIGNSTQAITVRADVGSRNCVSVKPVRFELSYTGFQ
ncbi:hypothetical protein ACLOAU_04655 [Niabella sp. CJ426]|uniref:hypothetical protein n=1 Tax=Niabella sp. CJ426 TaxID=3393740 RepID=UPI003D0795AB